MPQACKLSVTSDSAPIAHPSPMMTRGRMMLPEPTMTWRPSFTVPDMAWERCGGIIGLVETFARIVIAYRIDADALRQVDEIG